MNNVDVCNSAVSEEDFSESMQTSPYGKYLMLIFRCQHEFVGSCCWLIRLDRYAIMHVYKVCVILIQLLTVYVSK